MLVFIVSINIQNIKEKNTSFGDRHDGPSPLPQPRLPSLVMCWQNTDMSLWCDPVTDLSPTQMGMGTSWAKISSPAPVPVTPVPANLHRFSYPWSSLFIDNRTKRQNLDGKSSHPSTIKRTSGLKTTFTNHTHCHLWHLHNTRIYYQTWHSCTCLCMNVNQLSSPLSPPLVVLPNLVTCSLSPLNFWANLDNLSFKIS